MNYIRLFLSNQLVSVEGPCERRTSNAIVETVKKDYRRTKIVQM